LIQKKKLIKNKEKILSNLITNTDISLIKDSDLVVEAVVENLNIKKKIFKDLDKICNKKTIFATNTSSLSVTEISRATKRQNKFLGLHFFNPAPVMKLVELIKSKKTSVATYNTVKSIAKKLDKTVVEVKDSPGFISNRLLFVMINEAIVF